MMVERESKTQRLRPPQAWRLYRFALVLTLVCLAHASTTRAAAAVPANPSRVSTDGSLKPTLAAQRQPLPIDPTERKTEKPKKVKEPTTIPKGRQGRRPPVAQTQQSAMRSGVTFVTNIPQADILLSSGGRVQKLGNTGAAGKLNVRLAHGVHDITAVRTGYRNQRQHISVRPGSNTFNFNLTEQPTGATNVMPTRAPATADEVLRRYLDPQQTGRVTSADWQLVQEQSAAAFASDPSNTSARGQALFAQGQLASLRGSHAEALSAFNNAALALPTSALAFYGLGNAYLALNQPQQAVRAYQRAIELNEAFALPYVGMYEALVKQRKRKEAQKYLERARQLGYTSLKTSLNYARDLMSERRWAEALRELQELVRTHPTADVYIAIGDCYVGLKQPFSAAPAYRRSIELDARSATAHAKLGEVLYEEREYAAARDSFARALTLDPAGSNINLNRVLKLSKQAASKIR